MLTRLDAAAPQVLVLTKPDRSGVVNIVVANASTNPRQLDTSGISQSNFTTMRPTEDSMTVHDILMQPIDDLLIPPSSLSTTLDCIANVSSIREILSSLTLLPGLDSTSAITLFAPTDQAILEAQSSLSQFSDMQEISKIFLNHIVNGTVLYSPQLPSSLESNSKAHFPSAFQTSKVINANGLALSFSYNDSRDSLGIYLEDSLSANVLRTDVLTNNGVIHYVDKVFINASSNASLASKVAGVNQASRPVQELECDILSLNSTLQSFSIRNILSGKSLNLILLPTFCIVVTTIF